MSLKNLCSEKTIDLFDWFVSFCFICLWDLFNLGKCLWTFLKDLYKKKNKKKIVHGAVNPGRWQFWGGYEGIGWRHPAGENDKFSYIVNQFRSYSL